MELEQLQQLSLAAHKQSSKKPAAPKPLFVIEHETVVPPLKRQLESDGSHNRKAPTDKDAPHKTATDNTSHTENVTKSNSRQVSARNKAAVDSQAVTTQAASKPKATRATTSVAQTPKMVTLNNEPIPSKRRRKPSIAAVVEPVAKQKPVAQAQYEKKAPKSSQQQAQPSEKLLSTKSAKAPKATKVVQAIDQPVATKARRATKAKKPVVIQATDMSSKEAIPAKRRRRQPSSDHS